MCLRTCVADIVLVLTMLFSPCFILAQDSQTDLDNILVHVKELKLEKTEINAGDELKGKFRLTSYYGQDVPDVRYEVVLLEEFDEEKSSGSTTYREIAPGVFVNGKEGTPVEFKVRVPSVKGSGKSAVRIQALRPSGLAMGWASVPLAITGGKAPVKIEAAAIVIGEKSFIPESGPTIYQLEQGDLVTILGNDSAGSIAATPSILIWRFGQPDRILYSRKAPAITIKSGEEKTPFILELPDFERKAGVYTGTMVFTDKKGEPMSAIVDFRYVIGGQFATIHSLSSSKPSVKRGEEFEIEYHITGEAPDIARPDRAGSPAEMQIATRVFNESDKLIASKEENIELAGTHSRRVRLAAGKDAFALRGSLIVKRGDVVMATYETALSPDYAAQKKMRENARTLYLLFALCALAVISGAAFTYLRKRSVFLLLSVFLAFCGPFVSLSSAASGRTDCSLMVDNQPPAPNESGMCYWLDSRWDISATVNEPNGPLQAGEQFYITVRATHPGDGSGSTTRFVVRYNGTTIDSGKIGAPVSFKFTSPFTPPVYAAYGKSWARGAGFLMHFVHWRTYKGTRYNGYDATGRIGPFIAAQNSGPVEITAETYTKEVRYPGFTPYAPQLAGVKRLYYPIEIGSNPVGYHDAVNDVSCSTNGWACDPDDFSRPLDVHFYTDGPGPAGFGRFIGATTAGNSRNEGSWGNTCNGNRNHGFVFNLPEEFRDSAAHNIYAYAINVGPGNNNPLLNNSPKTILCKAAGAPTPTPTIAPMPTSAVAPTPTSTVAPTPTLAATGTPTPVKPKKVLLR